MKNKKDNLNELKVDEITKRISALQEEARVLRFKAEGSKSKNVKESATLRKQIARLMTEMNAR